MELASSAGNKVYRQQNFTLSATVSTPDNSPVTGQVILKDNGELIETQRLNNRTALFNIKYQTVGDHAFTVEYFGNESIAGSASRVTVSVLPKETTRINLIPSQVSISQGQEILLSATVTSNASHVPAKGSVIFKDGDIDLAPPVEVIDGSAKLTTRLMNAGTRTLKASYTGDFANQSSNQAVNVTVTANTAAAPWFQSGGNIPFGDSKDPNASVQYGLDSVRLNAIDETTGFVARGGAGLAYAKVPDPLNQNDGRWVQYRVSRDDPATHNGNNRRTEESMKKTLYMGDEVWVVFEWFTPVDKGLGQLRARNSGDSDNAAIFQVHHDDAQNHLMPGISAPLISLNIGTNMHVSNDLSVDNRNGYLTFALSEIENKVDSQSRPKFSQRPHSIWLGGLPGKYISSYSGFAAPGWPSAFVGSKIAFAIHFKLGYQPGTFYTRAWVAKRGDRVTKVMDNVTIGNMPDISRTTTTPATTPVAYIKNGLYAYNIPADAHVGFEWISMKKTFEVYQNQNAILSNPGKTEDQVAEMLIRKIQN